MTKNVEGISLKKSKRVIDGKPNLPTPDKLVEGEIAINYAEGYETISTKNESGVITVFSSDDYYTKKKLGSGFTEENSAKTVTDAIGEVVDELEAHTASTSHMDATEKENLDSLAANIAAISGITAEKVERWDEGSISAHTHENKEYLDAISGYVGTMAYEEKTDYTTTAVTDALNTVVTAHTADTDIHITSAERTAWNDKVGYAEYNSTDEKIYFYKNNTETATSLCEIDASSFIVDGMVEDVELVTSGDTTALVITWNTDAGSKTITLDVGDIFEADNYYTKSETSGATEIATALAEKLAISDFNTYSAATDTLINSKASQSDLDTLSGTVTAHTADTDIHMNATEKENLDSLATNISAISGITSVKIDGWDGAVLSAHSHDNKAYIDTITGNVGTMAYENKESYSSATEVATALGSGFTVSSVTEVIESNERVVSSALNYLNTNKLDVSAYTPTDLSDYYKKNETSGATELSAAFSEKANTATTLAGYGITDAYTKSETSGATEIATALVEKLAISDFNAYSGAVDTLINSKASQSDLDTLSGTVTAHTADTDIHITSAERTAWNDKVDFSDLVNYFDGVKYELSGSTHVINFYNDNTVKATIDATDFIKDGMIDTVELVQLSGDTYLRITWNTDAGKEVTDLNLGDIFDADNYYTKTQIDNKLGSGFTVSSVTEVIESNERVVSSALNYLNTNKLDVSAYTPTDLSNYYQKNETSGATEIATALAEKLAISDFNTYSGAVDTLINSKASQSDLDALSGTVTAHTADTNVHMNATEKENLDSLATNIAAISGITSEKIADWDEASVSAHTHDNKAVLDAITGNVGTMAYENATSYSSATEVNAALAEKSDTSHTHASSAVTSMAGYAMAASGNPITTADTLNQAIGKLEKSVEDGLKLNEKGSLIIHSGQEYIDSYNSFVFGGDNTAHSQTNDVIIGSENIVDGDSDNEKNIILGTANSTYGKQNTIIGHGNDFLTNDVVNNIHVIGDNNELETDGKGYDAYILGKMNKINADSVRVVGYSNTINTDGLRSSVIGDTNTANNAYQFIGGAYLIGYNEHEAALGWFNDSNESSVSSAATHFSIGNGDNGRHNALEIKGNGDMYIVDTSSNAADDEKPMINLQDTLETLSGASHSHSNKSAIDAITGNVGTMAYENASSYSSATEVNAALAEKSDTSHTHASSAVTSMDGYAMAASGNPITTADTLNQAIGKLEKMIDEFKEYVSQKELVISAALNDLNDRMGGMTLVKLTQAEYDALTVKDPNTMYIINN